MSNIKKVLSILMICIFCFETSISVSANDKTEKELYDEEVQLIFPEYAEFIDKSNLEAAILPTVLFKDEDTEPQVLFAETRSNDSGEKYSLIVYDNNTYIAAKSIVGTKVYNQGSSTSGPDYISYTGGTLTVWMTGAAYAMTVFPISYMTVYGSNPDFFLKPATASIPDGTANPVIISAYPYKEKEDSSGPAYAYFSTYVNIVGTNLPVLMNVLIKVGNDKISFYINEVEI